MKRVAIIGSGASGFVFAKRLLENTTDSIEVVVFEKGDFFYKTDQDFAQRPNDSLQYQSIRPFAPRPSTGEPRLFKYETRDKDYWQTDSGWTANVVGGGTLIYGAASWRFPYEDFNTKSIYKGIVDNENDFANWPEEASHKIFEKYYIEAEKMIGVSGEGSHYDDTRANDYPLKPLANSNIMAHFKNAATKITGNEKTTTTVPLAIDTRRCHQCNPCMEYPCDIFAKNTTAQEIYASISNKIILKTKAMVAKVFHQNGEVKGIEYVDTSNENFERKKEYFDIVVLAASSIESARLWLLSDLPDYSNMAGHYLTFHLHPVSVGFFDHDVQAIYQYHQAATTNYCKLDYKGRKILGGLVDLNATYTPHGFFRMYWNFKKLLKNPEREWGDEYYSFIKENFTRHISLGGSAEDLPRYDNRVEIDKGLLDKYGIPVSKITFRDHTLNRFVWEQLVNAQTKILKEMGAKQVVSNNFGTMPDAHQHGSLRFGSSKKNSVLTPYCEAWSVKRLFCIDGAGFPNSGCVNPTLTIQANAIRVADYVASTI